jgi:glucokinase
MTATATTPGRSPLLLAGDIGGTKTDFGVYTLEHGPRAPIASGRLPSDQYTNFEQLVEAFLTQHDLRVDYACFAVAGPVIDGHVNVTNLPWKLDERALADTLKLKQVWLLNDLLATASAVPYLVPDDLHTLNPGTPVRGGTIAVIAPGTGLGEAFLTFDGTRYRAYPSEGGHCDFGPTNQTQVELYLYLHARFGHVSYERVCSGIGMPTIYQFLRDQGTIPEASAIAARLAQTPQHEQASIISDAALDEHAPDKLCAAALEMFVSILGAETANLMLKVLSTGGVYIAGGIPVHILPALQAGTFMQSATNKGRFAELVRSIPMHIVTNEHVALIGSASHGLEMLRASPAMIHA